MPRTPTPFWNKLSGKAYADMVGLIANGETDAAIANWLDTSEAYVLSVRNAIAATVASTAAIYEANALVIRQQTARKTMARDTGDYNNPPLPTVLNTTTAAGRRTLSLPGCTITIDGVAEGISSADLNLNTAGNWDATTPTNYTVAATRAGVDFFVYATGDGYVLSAAADAPDGYTSTDSHKIGGFSCIPVAIGAGVAGAELSGFLAGDIIPGSIWDINPATVPTT